MGSPIAGSVEKSVATKTKSHHTLFTSSHLPLALSNRIADLSLLQELTSNDMAEHELEAAQRALRKADYDDEASEGEEFRSVATASTSTDARLAAFNPLHQHAEVAKPSSNRSLFDEGSAMELTNLNEDPLLKNTDKTGSGLGFLEMEDASSTVHQKESSDTIGSSGYQDLDFLENNEEEEPIRTSSGLLLTHRKAPSQSAAASASESHTFREAQQDFFEQNTGNSYYGTARQQSGIHGNGWNNHSSGKSKHSMAMLQAKRFLSYVKIWMMISAVFLLVATRVFVHALGHHNTTDDLVAGSSTVQQKTVDGNSGSSMQQQQQLYPYTLPDSIVLVPKEGISQMAQQQQQTPRRLLAFHEPTRSLKEIEYQPEQTSNQHMYGIRQDMHELRQEFEQWVTNHGKTYHSHQEKENRFQIWTQNHHR